MPNQMPQSPGLSVDSLQNNGMSLEIKDFYQDEKSFFKYVVPKKYAEASLETCDKQPKGFISFARKWALNPTSVFLFGGYGSGKTQFAFAMLREMFRVCPVKMWPRYFTSPELDSKFLEASKSDGGDKWTIRDMGDQDLLFIDDFGRESKSDRLKRQYFELLNYRHVNQKPTILTSNSTLDDLGGVLDGAIASRMQEWDILHFKNKDLRKGSSRPLI